MKRTAYTAVCDQHPLKLLVQNSTGIKQQYELLTSLKFLCKI